MRVLLIALAVLLLAAAGYFILTPGHSTETPPGTTGGGTETPPGAPLDGHAVLFKYDCTFCHVTNDTDAAKLDDPARNCAACHIRPEHGPRKNQQIAIFLAPNIDQMGSHLREDWLRKYLAQPTHIRKHHRNEMPAFRYEDGEIDALVNYILSRSQPPAPTGDTTFLEKRTDPAEHASLSEKGLALGQEYGCFDCHEFSGNVTPIDTTKRTINRSHLLEDTTFFAPDLRYSRERLRPEAIVGMILDPRKYDPTGFMEAPWDMSEEDAQTIAYAILNSDLGPMPEPPAITKKAPEDPDYRKDIIPLIFKYCLSCHYEGDTDMMGTATGYEGGFGFPAKHLDMSKWEFLMKGAQTGDGDYYPVVNPGHAEGILLARLKGDMYPKMPFGLKMDPVDIQTFENWILKGCKATDEQKDIQIFIGRPKPKKEDK